MPYTASLVANDGRNRRKTTMPFYHASRDDYPIGHVSLHTEVVAGILQATAVGMSFVTS